MADSCLSKLGFHVLNSIHFLHDCFSHCRVTDWFPVHIFINKIEGLIKNNGNDNIRTSTVLIGFMVDL